MIKTVQLTDFLSHSDNTVELDSGLTVFIGHNGSGKSSVIDAITFALFGKHTRDSKKGLVRIGASKGQASVEFSINERNYKAIRTLSAKGTLTARFYEIIDGTEKLIAEGERSQLGSDTMTHAIESKIGLDFEKIKIASIVQQGELDYIIKVQPKEFKELLNSIITIDKLDSASGSIKEIKDNFRKHIQKKFGYDDTHIDVLTQNISDAEEEIKQSKPKLKKLELEKSEQEKIIQELKVQVEKLANKESMLDELETRKNELFTYAREKIKEISNKNSEDEEKIDECKNSLTVITGEENLESEIKTIGKELDDIKVQILTQNKEKSRLDGHISLAEKLKLKDGKCPVCDSEVGHLKKDFQIEHIKQETKSITEKISLLEKNQNKLEEKADVLDEKLEIQRNAKAILAANNISNATELKQLEQDLSSKKNQIQQVSAALDSGQLLQIASIDTHAKKIFDTISKLDIETKDFDRSKFLELKGTLDENQAQLRQIDTEYGGITERLQKAKDEVSESTVTLNELKIVQDYVSQLEHIQKTVYKVDGPVAKSLRSWALNTISQNASRYIEMLNTKINHIKLEEKARNISIICKRGSTQYDLKSLSGGERVTVAIALRLGMAHLLGSSNLNFMILDEPTSYLDSEHRLELVKVLSQLSGLKRLDADRPLQLLIITHDAEIFENSMIDNIYKFSKIGNETKIETSSASN